MLSRTRRNRAGRAESGDSEESERFKNGHGHPGDARDHVKKRKMRNVFQELRKKKSMAGIAGDHVESKRGQTKGRKNGKLGTTSEGFPH